MLSEKDFSLSNPEIKGYFEFTSNTPPEGEIKYLHTHPLVTPNFVEEINILVVKAGERLASAKGIGYDQYIKRIQETCIKLGESIPNMEMPDPANTLFYLREAYTLSNEILRNKT